MEWLIAGGSILGFGAAVAIYLLWSGRDYWRQEADIRRLKIEELQRQVDALKTEAEVFRRPRGGPDDIIGRL